MNNNNRFRNQILYLQTPVPVVQKGDVQCDDRQTILNCVIHKQCHVFDTCIVYSV